MIRILLVEDQMIIRQALKRLLESYGQFTIAGEADSLATARKLIPNHNEYDVILLDLQLSDGSGLDLLYDLDTNKTKVLILSSFDDYPLVEKAFQLGVNGYMLKNADADRLAKAIEVIHCGGTSFDPNILQQMINVTKNRTHNVLTKQEIQILQALSGGKTAIEIADEIHVSERTIRRYLDAIYEKLNVHNKAQAIAESIRLGLVN
jgi:DNA-binding NarL/FixJ family response regulator